MVRMFGKARKKSNIEIIKIGKCRIASVAKMRKKKFKCEIGDLEFETTLEF
jgi:hypothetical protein